MWRQNRQRMVEVRLILHIYIRPAPSYFAQSHAAETSRKALRIPHARETTTIRPLGPMNVAPRSSHVEF